MVLCEGPWYLLFMLREGVHDGVLEPAQVRLDARGIFRIVYQYGRRIELDDVLWIRTRHQHAAGAARIPVLVDVRNIRAMSLTARRAAAGAEIARITSRMAVLVEGPVSAVIGNFFIRVTRPPYPVRLFTNVEAAEAWLLEPSSGPSVGAPA